MLRDGRVRVPETGAHLVHPNDPTLLPMDPISHQDVRTLQHPVERGRWIAWRGAQGGPLRKYFRPMPSRQIYDLGDLQRWAMQRRPFTDPMTNLPVDWKADFDAVRWREPIPPHLQNRPNYTQETEDTIHTLIAAHQGQEAGVHDSEEGDQEFRRRMAMSLQSAHGDALDGVLAYWDAHPSNIHEDSPEVVETYDFFNGQRMAQIAGEQPLQDRADDLWRQMLSLC